MFQSITLLTSSIYSLPSIAQFDQLKVLNEIIIPNAATDITSFLSDQQKNLLTTASDHKTPAISEKSDLVIVFGYPHKLTINLTVPVINVHFGPLPENRGPDPVFWTLRNGKSIAYVAVHHLEEELDSGPLLIEKGIDILPYENYGLLSSRLSMEAPKVLQELLFKSELPKKTQDNEQAEYYGKPDLTDLLIDWKTMKTQEIENIIRAANPKYGGAKTTINGAPISILEAERINVTMNEKAGEVIPGTIVHSSADHGLAVSTLDNKFLQLGIISTNEGVFTGKKLAQLGTPTGLVLGN